MMRSLTFRELKRDTQTNTHADTLTLLRGKDIIYIAGNHRGSQKHIEIVCFVHNDIIVEIFCRYNIIQIMERASRNDQHEVSPSKI